MKFHDKEYFYKYVTADVAKLILSNLKVKYSSPMLFNDPFDTQFNICIDTGKDENSSKEINEQIYDTLAKAKSIDDSYKTAFINTVNLNKTSLSSFFSFYENLLNSGIQQLKQRDRIFCISENNDSLLMWAHYADEHKGAVIKFKCLPDKDTVLCAAQKVNYSMSMPCITLDKFIAENCNENNVLANKILNEMLLTKSKEWEYEQEWRVIFDLQDGSKDFDYKELWEEELDSIYLGCRMIEKDKQELLNIIKTKRKNIKIFEAEKDAKEFKLNFNEIKYE